MPFFVCSYGMLVYWVVDPETNYPLKAIPYLGKNNQSTSKNKGLAHQMVMDLLIPYYKTQRNVTTDNFLTNKTVAEDLAQNGITMVGTVRANKSWIPQEFLEKRNVGSCLYGYRNDSTLLSFQAKAQKVVLIYSTMHIGSTDHNENEKPPLVQYLISLKAGWTVWIKCCTNLGLLASYLLFTLKNPLWKKSSKIKRTEYLISIANSLAYSALKLRSQSNNLPRTLKTEINVCISKISGMNVSSDQVEFEEHSEIKIPFSKLSKSSKSRLACVTCPSSKRQQSERTQSYKQIIDTFDQKRYAVTATKKSQKSWTILHYYQKNVLHNSSDE
ncbi:Host cell factor 2 [Blomia tropicalis]|nr:Host cell factor 2 [Blomia tropicalis]